MNNTYKDKLATLVKADEADFTPLLKTLETTVRQTLNEPIREALVTISDGTYWDCKGPNEAANKKNFIAQLGKKYLQIVPQLVQQLPGKVSAEYGGDNVVSAALLRTAATFKDPALVAELHVLWQRLITRHEVVIESKKCAKIVPDAPAFEHSTGMVWGSVFTFGIMSGVWSHNHKWRDVDVYIVNDEAITAVTDMVTSLLMAQYSHTVTTTLAAQLFNVEPQVDAVLHPLQIATLEPVTYSIDPFAEQCCDFWNVVSLCVGITGALAVSVKVYLMGQLVLTGDVSPDIPVNIDVNLGVVKLVAAVYIRDNALWANIRVSSPFLSDKT
jgi:hypothetical protein